MDLYLHADMAELFLRESAAHGPITSIARPVQTGSLRNSGVPQWASTFAEGLSVERAWSFFKWLQVYRTTQRAPQLEALRMLLCARIAQFARRADDATLDKLFGPVVHGAADMREFRTALRPQEPWSNRF